MKVEVQSPYNRICISHNREGHRAFAVFLLSFFVGKCRRAVSGVRCRSPPLHLDFYISKIQIGGISGEIRTKKSIYQRKRRLCGTVLYGFLPPQASRQGIYGQAVYPRPRLSEEISPTMTDTARKRNLFFICVGLAVLHTLTFFVGVNLFLRRSTPMCNKNKITARKEETHAEVTDSQRRNAPL